MVGRRWDGDVPIAFPAAQEINVAATTVAFLVWPAMLRETMDKQRVWADQKERVM
jgi:hypothetical protein